MSTTDPLHGNTSTAEEELRHFYKKIVNIEKQEANLKEDKKFIYTELKGKGHDPKTCLLYTSPSPRDQRGSRMPSSA